MDQFWTAPPQEDENRELRQLLDQVNSLLEQMLVLAEQSARDSCTDRERAELQKMLEHLQNKLDRVVDNFNSSRGILPTV